MFKYFNYRWTSLTELTPWSTALPQKLTVLQLLKQFPAFCGT